jgi:hypothetical protein
MCCNECTDIRSEILNLKNRRAIEIYPDLTIGNINGICGGSRRRATAVNAYLANQLYSSPLYTDPNFVPPPNFVWPTGSGRKRKGRKGGADINQWYGSWQTPERQGWATYKQNPKLLVMKQDADSNIAEFNDPYNTQGSIDHMYRQAMIKPMFYDRGMNNAGAVTEAMPWHIKNADLQTRCNNYNKYGGKEWKWTCQD